MSTFKKLFASIAAVMIVLSTAPVAVFGQASRTAEQQGSYDFAFDNGLTTMAPSAARLNDHTTRGEFAKIISNYSINVLGMTADADAQCGFSDLASVAGTDLADYAVTACQLGLMGINTQGIFNPNGTLSRAEAFTVISRVLAGDTYDGQNPYYAGHLNFLNQIGLVNDISNPQRAVLRYEAFLVLERASDVDLDANLPAICQDVETVFACVIDPDGSMGLCPMECVADEDDTDDDTTYDDQWDVKVGDVQVGLAGSSVGPRSIPRTGLVPFGTFQLQAGNQAIQIGSITLKREGLSNRSDIRRVHLERNGVRVSSRSNISTDDTAMLSFSPTFAIPAGGTETLTLVVEMTDQGGGAVVGAQHNFAILSANAINSSANVMGSFPVRTATATVSSYTVETADVTIAVSATGTNVNVGDEAVSFGEFQIQTAGDKDNVFKSIALRNDGNGNVASSLTNLGLYRDGVLVSTNVSINNRDVTFMVNDTIDNGQSEIYQVRADVVGAERSDDDYEFSIRNTTDVTVIEEDSGFSAPITLASSNASISLGTVSVQGGDLLLSRDTAFQTTQTISANTQNVVLWAANLNVGQAVSIEDVTVPFSATGNGLQNISSLRLVVGNQTLATYTPASGDNSVTFETVFTLTQNTPIKILANFRNSANGPYTINGASLVLGSYDVRYVSNDETATIDGSAQGIVTNVDVAGLTAIRNDGIDNDSLVVGANNVLLLGFDLRANDVSDIRITSIQPTPTLGGIAMSQITNVRLYQGETLLATKNDFNFGTINVTIPQNEAKKFTVVADFSTAVSSGDTLSLAINSGNVAARNVQSNATVALDPAIASETFTFKDAGSVEVESNSSQANRTIVSPSMAEASVFTFDIEAKDDTLRLTDLYVSRSGSVDLASALRSATLTIGDNTANGVVLNSGMLHFTFGSNGVILDKDDFVSADLKVAFFDSNARTNETFQFMIPTTVAGAVNGTENGMRILSDSTGLTVDRGTASVESREHLLARSNPTVARQSEVSSQVAYKFTVTANANQKLALQELHFEVNGLTGTANFTLRKDENNTVMQTINGHDLVSSGNVEFDTLAQDFEVSAGTTTTYVVEISGLNTALNSGRTREVKIVDLIYADDVNTPEDISVAPYNVLPTTISSHFYPN